MPTIRRATAAPDPTGRGRLRRCSITIAALALPLTVMSAIAPTVAHAAPSAPAPEAAPADPGPSTTTSPTTTSPTTTPPTTTPPTTAAPTPVTAVVLADVATGAPPLVPQLASQGASIAGGPASLVRPSPAQLPATGGVDRGVGLVAMSLAGIGAALIGIGRRRRPV